MFQYETLKCVNYISAYRALIWADIWNRVSFWDYVSFWN